MVSICNQDGRLIGQAEWATGFWQRGRGWMGRSPPGRDHALLFAHCRAIHTCFMRFPLDLIFFTQEGCVTRIVRSVAPFRIILGGRCAWGVAEMQSGWFPWDRIKTGDRLVFRG
jgi:uncharacterized protein